MTKPTIKKVTPSNADQAIGTLVLAFSADHAARWVYPDPHQYLMNIPSFIRAFAGKAFEYNSAYFVDGYVGAALWLPPDIRPDENALVALLQRTIPEENQPDVFAFLEQMESYHPSEPHWYLPMIGVDPGHQHQGYGSALLQRALLACDRDNKLAYLESSSPKNIPLYERHGFKLLGTIQIGGSPPVFPMLRTPERLVLTEGNGCSSQHATGSAPNSISVFNG
jgi:ribosomal protein S18 acetylase RimI-like enzyme